MRGNTANYGGGLYLSAGTAENCTIAANSAGKGGGLYIDIGGAVSNSIMYFNQSINGSNYFNTGASYTYSHCCTAPNIAAGSGIIVADPRFLNLAAGDFRLATNSPCIDAGINSPWMSSASDLAENPRILNGIVDLGAFEALPPDWDIVHFADGQYLVDGRMKLTISGKAGHNYTLFASTNLTDWIPLFGFGCTNDTMDLFDPDATNFNYRFYRLKTR
jgi:hypothetical protein